MTNPFMLVAVIDREDGSVTDTGGYVLGEFATQDEAEEYACNLETQAPEFRLSNPPPKPAKWQGEPAPKCRQRKLLTGISCLSGQENLFDT